MSRPALALAALLGVAAPHLGCGQTACFQWYATEGACPDHNRARMFFGTCNDIDSINDDGKFGNDLCCYSVAKSPGRKNETTCPPTPGVVTSGPSAVTSVSSGPPPNTCDSTGVCGNPDVGCTRCAFIGPCSLEVDACNKSMDCGAYGNCIANCQQTSACIMQCTTQEPNGAQLWNALVDCAVCKSCPTACADVAAIFCSSGSTSSSSGSMSGGGMGGMSSSSGMGGAGGK